MNKRSVVLGALAAVVVGAAAVPYGFGYEVQAQFEQRMQQFAEASDLKIVRSDYRRGWLSSGADVVFAVPGVDLEIHTTHVIDHGPLSWKGESLLQPQGAHVATLATLKTRSEEWSELASALSLSAQTSVALDGTARTSFQSPAVKKPLPDGTSLDWQGIQGDAEFDAALQHVRVNAHAPKLEYPSLRLTDVRVRSDLEAGIAGHYLGNSSVHVKRVVVGPVLVNDFRIDGGATAQGQMLNATLRYTVGEVSAGEQRWGPGKLAIALRKIDAHTLASFQRELRALRGAERPTEQLGLMQLGKLIQFVGDLSKHAPEFEVTELALRTHAGDVTGTAKLVLDGSRVDIARNVMLILTTLAGDLELSFPAALLTPMLLPQLQEDLNAFAQRGLLKHQELSQLSGEELAAILDSALPRYLERHEFGRYLKRQGDRYVLNASLRRGQITVNGEPLSISGAGLLPALGGGL